MTAIEHFQGLLSISGCFWILYGLYTGLSIQSFIVKRYEEETNLSRTIYFSEFMPFARSLPNFFSSPLYSGHLLSFIWGWKFVKFIKEKRKQVRYYDDINSPDEIICHFSKKEIRSVKRFAIVCFILIAHIIAYYVFGFIWPEVFD